MDGIQWQVLSIAAGLARGTARNFSDPRGMDFIKFAGSMGMKTDGKCGFLVRLDIVVAGYTGVYRCSRILKFIDLFIELFSAVE